MRSGIVFNVQFFNLHDGPGIRTLVFLKGCPLRCRWCCNPESLDRRPQLGILNLKCDRCLKCLAACPIGAVSVGGDGLPRVDRQKCTACGECVPLCLPGALTIYGRRMNAAEVLEEVRRDKPFYDGSGGGVTATGGEPLLQASFVRAIFELCHQDGIHTCLETSGYGDAGAWQQILPVTDYVLFDLKHLDTQRHCDLTERPNRLILSAARTVASHGIPLMFRMPLVPGHNDDCANIEQTASFLKSLGSPSVQGIELMPYHRLGTAKYETLGMPLPLANLAPPTAAAVEAVRQSFETQGVSCRVSE
jgi:pyruvate formate lyase activating enzyme